MQIIRGLHNLEPITNGCVITIGNYDGIHIGHQEILRHVKQKAHELNLRSMVVTFNPQPREFFSKNNITQRLMSFREKYIALNRLNIDKILYLYFDQKLATLSAEAFIEEILIKKLNVKHVSVGEDFAFGHKRTGTVELLKKYGMQHGFQVEIFKDIKVDGVRVSSSEIRKTLSQDNLDAAQKMLGHPYAITERVVHGNKRGRTLGFPTANINLKTKNILPLAGVYSVKVSCISNHPNQINGIANIGFRPTIENISKNIDKNIAIPKRFLEVHLFDFNEDLYGKIITIEFIRKIRNEQKFDSIERLKQQIAQDIQKCKVKVSSLD